MFRSDSRIADFYLRHLLRLNALLSFFTVFAIFIFLSKESHIALGLRNFSSLNGAWHPTEGHFNMIPMILSTIIISFGSILIATPVGFFAALFACYYTNRKINFIFKRLVELYSGIPSVIFGFWGLMNIVPIINKISPPGQSLLAGILILALMIFPIITLNLITSFKGPISKLEFVCNSLGMSKSTYIWKVLLPSSKRLVLSSVLLALGRAIGETMAVLMVCGNIAQIPSSLFDPIRTLTANIALEMSYAMNVHRSALFLSGTILLLLIFLLSWVSNNLKQEKI